MGRGVWGGDVSAALVNISMHECGDDSCSSSRFYGRGSAIRSFPSTLAPLPSLFFIYLLHPPPTTQQPSLQGNIYGPLFMFLKVSLVAF